MLEWLNTPIDANRAHEIETWVAWHGRTMLLAWGIIAPLAVIVARFFKIMPGQDWPRELDNPVWWRSHWMGQSLVVVLSAVGLWMVLPFGGFFTHSTLGSVLLLGLVVQVLLGLFRGSKGGPTKGAPGETECGHHYDMTPWRRMFEALHKSLGYALIGLAAATIVLGLWDANGPVWMWLVLSAWWIALIGIFVHLQGRGFAVDTYQAIWGDDPAHPGNKLPAPGWWMRRPGDAPDD